MRPLALIFTKGNLIILQNITIKLLFANFLKNFLPIFRKQFLNYFLKKSGNDCACAKSVVPKALVI